MSSHCRYYSKTDLQNKYTNCC